MSLSDDGETENQSKLHTHLKGFQDQFRSAALGTTSRNTPTDASAFAALITTKLVLQQSDKKEAECIDKCLSPKNRTVHPRRSYH